MERFTRPDAILSHYCSKTTCRYYRGKAILFCFLVGVPVDNDLVRLRHFIRDHHNLEEFRTLCFDLGVRYDALGGEGLDAKARELLLHLGRQRRFDDLLKVLENTLTEPFRQASFNSHPVTVEALYAALPAFSGDEPPVTSVLHPTKRPPWQLALRVLAILSWVVAAVWFWAEPGFEPLLALLSGMAFFLGSFAVDRDEGAASAREAIARNRRISHALVGKVRAIWIQDVLENSLYNMARIELGLAKVPGAVERPWAMALERPGEEEKPLPTGTKIEDIFRQLNGAMLILGAPGSGKTVTLLALAHQLLDRAEEGTSQPVPLVFNLSSWGHKRLPLTEWLVEELHLLYDVSKKYALGWLQSASYTLLLDGLDEVAEAHRDACVAAINQFRRENGFTHIHIAVCSRIGDYDRLAKQLHLMGAVAIRPLSREQVNDYLAAGGESLAAARVAVNADALLQELAQTPLILNVIALAYQGRRLDELASGTLAERRRHLFAAYVQRMFERRGAVGEQERKRAIHYLVWLATRMSERSQTMYYIEEMQPAWLPQSLIRRYRGLYGLLLGLTVGPVVGLVVGLVIGQAGELSGWVVIGALVVGLSGGLGVAVATWLTTGVRRPWLRAGAAGLVTWLIGGLVCGLFTDLILGPILALVIGLGIIVGAMVASPVSVIQLRERVRPWLPSRQRIIQYIKRGAVYGLMIGALVGVLIVVLNIGSIEGLRDIPRGLLRQVLILGLVWGLIVELAVALVGGILAFLDTPPVDERLIPGEGVRASMRNALLMTALAALFVSLPTWFIDQRLHAELLLLTLVLINVLPPTFIWFGGLAACQHWALRFILHRRSWLPWRLVPWLDEMVARGLLRRVGGGYIFIHRMLLEYFADLEVRS